MEKYVIDVKSLADVISGEEKVAVLDVRRKADYDASSEKIPGAVWRDPEKIDQWINELQTDRQTVVYCVKGGSVSQAVTDRLRSEGQEAFYLEGGIKAWTENGKKIESKKS